MECLSCLVDKRGQNRRVFRQSKPFGFFLDTNHLEVLLNATAERAKEIHALAAFQTVPSIGIKFAEDLVFLGYYSLQELKNKDGARLTDDYERKKGYWIDPCVEDQFRLVVNFANTNDTTKRWWDFTQERKKNRTAHGYPANRPQKSWTEVLGDERKSPSDDLAI